MQFTRAFAQCRWCRRIQIRCCGVEHIFPAYCESLKLGRHQTGALLKRSIQCGSNAYFAMPEKCPTLKFVKLTEHARAPTRGSTAAAGFDLYSAYDYQVPAGGRCVCLTDLQVAVPEGCYGRVAPRSGLASKHGIDVGAGVVDADYRGNLGVLLFNFGSTDFTVSRGDRIAQFICERITYPELVECKSLDETERGEGGFGSTGLRG
ncbi:deoxyuridine 5'-triphosphate nucleotidohydrolase [Rhipicephalus sanguineus]|uniref:deoxyuridine 5'-triphosphate nucleotidohydrolase n=1 Tax=Rhipicephalus sanguineus TaxID=34632 RepID=UPI001893DA01|nr:deoxyuridine 5'-triphosphate nucleotidohydrolase [Rhipicephalus sanguineus]